MKIFDRLFKYFIVSYEGFLRVVIIVLVVFFSIVLFAEKHYSNKLEDVIKAQDEVIKAQDEVIKAKENTIKIYKDYLKN